MTGKQITGTMVRALDFMAANGGKIYRHAGGFWWRQKLDGLDCFSSSTVNAIVERKLAHFTEWKDGRYGRFPITAELGPEPGAST